jgi:hypothetical protein
LYAVSSEEQSVQGLEFLDHGCREIRNEVGGKVQQFQPEYDKLNHRILEAFIGIKIFAVLPLSIFDCLKAFTETKTRKSKELLHSICDILFESIHIELQV